MGMGFAPTWLRHVSPLPYKTTLTTGLNPALDSSVSGAADFIAPVTCVLIRKTRCAFNGLYM